MGYSTDFDGVLYFTTDLQASRLLQLKSMLEVDNWQQRLEWKDTNVRYIDLELTGDFTGLQWNGAEKTYYMVETVNLIITEMRKTTPDFGLKGKLYAQGEEFDDRWVLEIGEDGWAKRTDIIISGKTVTCPHCNSEFVLEEEDNE